MPIMSRANTAERTPNADGPLAGDDEFWSWKERAWTWPSPSEAHPKRAVSVLPRGFHHLIVIPRRQTHPVALRSPALPGRARWPGQGNPEVLRQRVTTDAAVPSRRDPSRQGCRGSLVPMRRAPCRAKRARSNGIPAVNASPPTPRSSPAATPRGRDAAAPWFPCAAHHPARSAQAETAPWPALPRHDRNRSTRWSAGRPASHPRQLHIRMARRPRPQPVWCQLRHRARVKELMPRTGAKN